MKLLATFRMTNLRTNLRWTTAMLAVGLFGILPGSAHAQKQSAKKPSPGRAKQTSKAAESPQARKIRVGNALIQAVRKRDVLRTYELLEAGADPNTRDSKGTPPLISLVRNEGLSEEERFKPGADRLESEIIELLIARGAKIDAHDSQGMTALFATSLSILDFTVAEQLLKLGADPNIVASSGLTPLMGAAISRNAALIKMLLDRGAKVNTQAKDGNTALICSLAPTEDPASNPSAALNLAFNSPDEVAGLLLEHGADVKVVGAKKITALHMAALSGTPSLIRQFLAKGADIDAVADDNFTPLFIAALAGRADNAKALISRGANAKALARGNFTILMAAAASGSYSLTEALLATGVDSSARDTSGKSAADYASAGGKTGLLGLLRKAPQKSG